MSWSTLVSGDAVEVLSDEDDAAWRPARLIHPFLRRHLYFVVFEPGAVRATIPAARVRPRPHPSAASSVFKLHQLVDALVNSVWRPGVVSKVHVAGKEGRYGVCFPFAREVMVFGSGEIRARLDWVDTKWVPAEKKGTTETMYKIGSHVEVAQIIKNLPVAWYPATVIKAVDEKILLVEYGSLKTEDDTLLTEVVASQYIRPHPPPTLGFRNFNMLDEVEASYNGGWWPGVVTKVNTDSRYHVKFIHCEEEVEFSHTELRLLCDWIDGQWVEASQDKPIKSQILPASNTPKSKAPGSTTPLSPCQDEALCQLPISIMNSENENTCRLSFQSQLDCLQPYKKAKKGETIEDNTRLLDSRGTETSEGTEISGAVKMGFDVCTPIIEEEPNFHIKSLVEKCCSSGPFENMNLASVSSITKLSSNILLEDPPVTEKLGQEPTFSCEPVSSKQEDLSKERPVNSEFLLTVKWCQCRRVWWPSQQQTKELVVECEHQSDKGARQHTPGDRRRKNSRPRKLRIIEPSLEGDSAVNEKDNTVVVKPQIEELSTTKCGGCSDVDFKAQELFNAMVSSSHASLVETSASGVQLSEAGSEEREAESEAKNEVLLSIVDKQLPNRVVTEKAGDAIEPRLDKSPQEQSSLPFKKCSSIWDYIESMEVFSIMPQRPHFRPLEQYSKDFREGVAIGLMVTFSNLFNSISKLQIADSCHKFDDMLRTLVNLEGYGFDVQRLRARLAELLKMKSNQERLVDERSALEVLLTKAKREKYQVDAELESTEKAARELEQSLSLLYEEKRQISEQKRETDSKLDKLDMDSRRVENALLSTEYDFKATLSAMW